MIFALLVIKRMLEEIRINTEDKDCTQGNGVENSVNKAGKKNQGRKTMNESI